MNKALRLLESLHTKNLKPGPECSFIAPDERLLCLLRIIQMTKVDPDQTLGLIFKLPWLLHFLQCGAAVIDWSLWFYCKCHPGLDLLSNLSCEISWHGSAGGCTVDGWSPHFSHSLTAH